MAQVEVLFRESGVLDGIQSRGVGWHAREVGGESLKQSVAGLAGELAQGDLVRLQGKGVSLLVLDGRSLRPVRAIGLRSREHYSDASRELAESLQGDWVAYWEAIRSAPDLLYQASLAGLDPRPLALCACDCAETVLRLVPRGAEQPRRALREIRRWAAGVATPEAVRLAAYHARARAILGSSFTEAAHAVSYAAAATFSGAREEGAHAADEAARAATAFAYGDNSWGAAVAARRTLSFLVLVRLPVWRVCLAAVRKGDS